MIFSVRRPQYFISHTKSQRLGTGGRVQSLKSCLVLSARLNVTSNFLDQYNPKSKYYCKNELVHIRDFEAVQKTRNRVFGLKTRGEDNTLLLVS